MSSSSVSLETCFCGHELLPLFSCTGVVGQFEDLVFFHMREQEKSMCQYCYQTLLNIRASSLRMPHCNQQILEAIQRIFENLCRGSPSLRAVLVPDSFSSWVLDVGGCFSGLPFFNEAFALTCRHSSMKHCALTCRHSSMKRCALTCRHSSMKRCAL